MKWHEQQEQIFILERKKPVYSSGQTGVKEIWGGRGERQLLTASQKNVLKVLSRNVVETQEFLLL